MEKVLLDSTVMVHLQRAKSEMVAVLKSYPGTQFCISIVTYAEILGVEKKRRKTDARKLLQPYTVIPIHGIVQKNVYLNSYLYEVPPTQVSDFLIACTAMALGITFVTANEKHFQKYKGLKLHPYSIG